MWKEIEHQPQAISILQRAIMHHRAAHAYLFTGPRGVGKQKTALQMAKSLLCSEINDGESCDRCTECIRIDHGNHPDVHLIAPEGGSIKIAQIRDLRREFSLRAVEATRKVYILLEAESMTREAANSLLKFLEEPSGLVTAILITENPSGILPTIRSRCQMIRFQELPWQKVVSEASRLGYSEGDLRVAAQIVRNLEEIKTLCQSDEFASIRNIVIKFYHQYLTDKTKALVKIEELILQDPHLKENIELFVDLSVVWFRDLLHLLVGNEDHVAYIDVIDRLKQDAARSSLSQVSERLGILLQTRNRLKWMNAQLALEQMMIRLCS